MHNPLFYDYSEAFETDTDRIISARKKFLKRSKYNEEENNREIKIGKIYKHFKGNFYLVKDIAIHSETKEKYVVYQALYENMETYIRPYNMFNSKVDKIKYPDIKQKYRFEEVTINKGKFI